MKRQTTEDPSCSKRNAQCNESVDRALSVPYLRALTLYLMPKLSPKAAERKTNQLVAELFSKFPSGKNIPCDEIVAAIMDMGRNMSLAGCTEDNYQRAVQCVQEGFSIPDDEWKDMLRLGIEFLEHRLGCTITGLN